MTRYALLDNVAHKDLRIVARFGREFGDATSLVPAYPTEWAELQREYPLFFRRDAEGAWQCVALLGFERDENLFLQGDRWNAGYLPGAVAKGPFLIGFQDRIENGEPRHEPVVHVDLAHPRASFVEGEAVFLPQGGRTPYLEHVLGVLRGIHDGVEAGKAMYAAFDAAGLIQPLDLQVQLDERHRVNLTGLHGVDRDRLAALDAETLLFLHRAGYLEGAYLLLASMHNMRRLMAEKQRRLREQDAAPQGRIE